MRRLAALMLALCLWPCAALGYRLTVPQGDLSIVTGLPQNVVNVLLLGTDSWEDVREEGRSDTMIVCSCELSTGRVRLLFLARDLLVHLPYQQGYNRLNTAHAFGGPALAMKTINELLGLNVERYVSLNIHGLRRIIDSMGGLQLHLQPEEARAVNRMIGIEFPGEVNPKCPSGEATLNGLQAMTYARIRDLDSDFGRMDRQREVLLSMAGEASTMTPERQMALLAACMREVATNLEMADILRLSNLALAHGLDVEAMTLPQPGTYLFDDYKGMSVLFADDLALSRAAHAFLYEDDPQEGMK